LLQDWADLGELSAEVVQLFESGHIDEDGVAERMCSASMYFVSG
jgi:hypothetical protein